MRFNRLQGMVLAVMLLMVGSFVASNLVPVAHAQSATTGAIGGDVKDPSGAFVPNAKVTITNTGTNSTSVVKTNAEGRFTASQLNPGIYKVSATAAGLQSSSTELEVLIGTTVTANIKVTPAGNIDKIEVTASTLPLVDTQNVALATTFNEQQIQELPAPGGDVTTVAFTAPGVVVNAGGSYGNFSANGLPGISNLFVLNGFDNQDPFLNLNNSGSSNLSLGQGELAEATVVENGYNSQFGRAAGVTIQYTTKSGTNGFHGEADYNYNGSILNANGWFNNLYSGPRPHAVSNEWAGNVGGPIIKDKVFFFGDYEGLFYVLPGASGLINYPTSAFQTATTTNYAANGVDTGLLATQFTLFQGAPSYSAAAPIATTTQGSALAGAYYGGGCGEVKYGGMSGLSTGTPHVYWGAVPNSDPTGSAIPCMSQAFAETNNINKEWLFTGRLDWDVSDRHKIFGRYKMDRGSQPTGTSFINPAFSVVSIQPEYEGQFNDSYIFSPTKTNVFVMAANWYTAYFGPANIAATDAVYPWNEYTDLGDDNSGTPGNGAYGMSSIGAPYYFPQGRNVTQYQFQDDFTWVKGKHNLKFGANFRRDLIEDYDAQVLQDYPLNENYNLSTYFGGQLSPGSGIYIQNYPVADTAHLALYNLGVYAQDEWQVSNKFKLTLGIRVDHTGNPLCHGACFSTYAQGTYPSGGASYTQPYNAADGGSINSANNHPFQSADTANIQPRFGFNYSISDKTEIRGGIGFFSDLYPATFLDGVIQNFPNVNSIATFFGNLDTAAADPTHSVTAYTNLANTALASGYASGGTVTSINEALTTGPVTVPFTPPAVNAYFPGKFHVPEYVEYNLQIQRELNKSTAVIINYTGNYGYREILQNSFANAGTGYYNASYPPGSDNTWDDVLVDMPTVPVQPADPSFSKITSYTNTGHSNFNGVWISVKHGGHGLTGQLTYAYSHSLDTISNAGVGLPYNGGSIVGQLTPSLSTLNLNYSNSDYDIRNNLTADVVYEQHYKNGNPILSNILGGWVLGGKTYYRSGEPFSVTNGWISAGNYGYEAMGSTFMGQATVPNNQLTNTTASDPHGAVLTPGLGGPGGSDYASPYTQATLGNIRRNSLYGPHYANTDMSITKSLYHHEKIDFKIGANAYNIFNHANFANPDSALGTNAFGLITGTLAPPTSPYGSFQGAAVTQRIFQLHGKIVF